MRKILLVVLVLVLFQFGLFASAHATHIIQVLAVGGNFGNQAANTVFSSGDLMGSVDRSVGVAAFNAMTVANLRASYDVILVTWASPAALNLDWATRIVPYLALGGGVLFEDPNNAADLAPGVTAIPMGAGGSGISVSAVVPGLTDGIIGSFVNTHITFSMSSWHPKLSPFLTDDRGRTVGLYGQIGAGRIVMTGPDQDWHGLRGAGGAAGNQYNLLLNELRWVSHPVVIPEPSSLVLLGIGGICMFGYGWRRRKRSA